MIIIIIIFFVDSSKFHQIDPCIWSSPWVVLTLFSPPLNTCQVGLNLPTLQMGKQRFKQQVRDQGDSE